MSWANGARITRELLILTVFLETNSPKLVPCRPQQYNPARANLAKQADFLASV